MNLLQEYISILLFLALILVLPRLAHAQTSSNSDFTIEHKELEQRTYHPENEEIQNPRIIKGRNWQAVMGFGDEKSEHYFSFKISNTLLDYGKLYPTNPILREAILEVEGLSTHGYSVLAYEDHPLADATFSNLIPDTSCDRGLCSSFTSAIWKERLTYGFGYTCEDLEKPICFGFENTDFFKRFSDASKNEVYQPVLKAIDGSNSRAKIIHKLNLSSSQKDKIYLNNINYVAIPHL